jgi:hypothetical protein
LHATPQEVSIDIDPSYAYESAALTLCVCFHSPAINNAVARQEWRGFWEFGDGLREEGLKLSAALLIAVLDWLPVRVPNS